MTQLDALLRTLALELPVGLACMWLVARAELRVAGWRAPIVVIAASLLTHPFAWWGNKSLVGAMEFWPRVTIVELSLISAAMIPTTGVFPGSVTTRPATACADSEFAATANRAAAVGVGVGVGGGVEGLL